MEAYTTEEQQVEEIKKWWKENGMSVIGGIVLGLGAIFGWRAWQTHQNTQAETASGLYQEMMTSVIEDNTARLAETTDELLGQYPSTPYAVFARLQLARQAVDENDLQQAEEHLRWALDKNKDDSFAHEIRLRLARVLAARDKADEALALLKVTDRGAWSGSYDELSGDILTQQGDVEAALAAYQQAQSKFRSAGTDISTLEIKLDDLGRIDP